MFSSRFFSLALPALALIGLAALPAAAQTYSAANDFSATVNPNGVWSYGYETTLGGGLTLYTIKYAPNGNVKGWNQPIAFDVPLVVKNFGAMAGGGFADLYLQPGQLAFHPGPNNEYSIVRFTAPSAGTYNLASSFSAVTTDGTTTDVHVLDNNVSKFDGTVTGTYQASVGSTYSNNFVLASGETIDFAVGNGGNGFYQDSTGLDATLTVAPEPSQVAPFVFLTFGLGAMVVLKKKKASVAA